MLHGHHSGKRGMSTTTVLVEDVHVRFGDVEAVRGGHDHVAVAPVHPVLDRGVARTGVPAEAVDLELSHEELQAIGGIATTA